MATLGEQEALEIFRREPDRYLAVPGTGVEVAYRRVGTGPDVLFVHGWPVSGATFRRLLPHLAGRVTCHLVDLPGMGWSRHAPGTALSIRLWIEVVRQVPGLLGLETFAVVGHDSGGLVARHAFAGDRRMRGLGLIDTEQVRGPGWRFRLFLAAGRVPGFGATFRRIIGMRRLRRNGLVLGSVFADASLLDGEFDALFLRPLREDPERARWAVELLRSFDLRLIRELPGLHAAIEAPVQLVWGERDRFFPVGWAREMVATFPRAALTVVPGAGLFAHEERPAEVAAALLPVLVGEA